MQTQVKKWGNSLALRIPRVLAQQLNITMDTPITISIIDGRLVITPLPEPAPSLDALLAGVTEENLHHEVNAGMPVGNEAW